MVTYKFTDCSLSCLIQYNTGQRIQQVKKENKNMQSLFTVYLNYINKTFPLRPIVSFCQAPFYRLCQKLSLIVPALTKFASKYVVKNTLELISKLNNVAISKNCRLVSFDVSNLFGSVPIKELKTILFDLLNKSPIPPKYQRELLNLLEICMSQNCCTFNSKFY